MGEEVYHLHIKEKKSDNKPTESMEVAKTVVKHKEHIDNMNQIAGLVAKSYIRRLCFLSFSKLTIIKQVFNLFIFHQK